MHPHRLILSLMLVILCIAGVERASAFYNPGTGRWLSKDPIQERGGINLYSFVKNQPTQRFDALGLLDLSGNLSGDPANTSTDYTVGDQAGVATSTLFTIKKAEDKAKQDLIQQLKTANPGWTIISGSDHQGTINVTKYSAAKTGNNLGAQFDSQL